MSRSVDAKHEARRGRSSDVDEQASRGRAASSSRRDSHTAEGEHTPARSLALSPKRLDLLPMLRQIRPCLVLTGRHKFLSLGFAGRAPTRRVERGGGARLSLSYSIDVPTLFKLAQSFVNAPFVLAGVILCVKALFERAQRERAREARFVLAEAARNDTHVESAVPGDTGIEQALTMSIPIDEPKTADEHEDDANDSWSDSSASLWDASDWSFCSDNDGPNAN